MCKLLGNASERLCVLPMHIFVGGGRDATAADPCQFNTWKPWSCLDVSHPAFEGRTPSFLPASQEVFSWVIPENLSVVTCTPFPVDPMLACSLRDVRLMWVHFPCQVTWESLWAYMVLLLSSIPKCNITLVPRPQHQPVHSGVMAPL